MICLPAFLVSCLSACLLVFVECQSPMKMLLLRLTGLSSFRSPVLSRPSLLSLLCHCLLLPCFFFLSCSCSKPSQRRHGSSNGNGNGTARHTTPLRRPSRPFYRRCMTMTSGSSTMARTASAARAMVAPSMTR